MKKMKFVRKGVQKEVRMFNRMALWSVLKIIKLSADKYSTRANCFQILGCGHDCLNDN